MPNSKFGILITWSFWEHDYADIWYNASRLLKQIPWVSANFYTHSWTRTWAVARCILTVTYSNKILPDSSHAGWDNAIDHLRRICRVLAEWLTDNYTTHKSKLIPSYLNIDLDLRDTSRCQSYKFDKYRCSAATLNHVQSDISVSSILR